MADELKELMRVGEVVRRMMSGKGSARSSENAPRQKQLDRDWEKALGIEPKKKPEPKKPAPKKKDKKKKKKKKKWYSK